MGKIYKTVRKHKWLSPAGLAAEAGGDKLFDTMHPLGTQAEAQYDATKAAEKALADAQDPENPANKVIPIADEEELAKQRRRARASRRGSTSSNIYTSDERLGG